jgi:hypothetical protein
VVVLKEPQETPAAQVAVVLMQQLLLLVHHIKVIRALRVLP